MKHVSIITIMTVCLGLICSCQQQEQDFVLDGSEVVLIASTEETKVTISEDCRTLIWSQDDAVSVLDGMSNVRYSTSEEGSTVRFTSESGISDEAEDLYAVYPYSDDVRRIEDGVQVVVPGEQTVSAPGFDPKSSLAVAYASQIFQETHLNFMNLCSYFKFTVPADDQVMEIVLRGGEKEYLAGKVDVTFAKGIPSCSVVEGLNEITFRSAVPMSGTYIVPLLPCVLQEGLSVTLKSKDGRSAVHKVVAKDETGLVSAVTFLRGKVNKATLSFDQPKWRNAPVAQVADVAASTITVRWSENGFSSADDDFAGKYHIALYSDEACSVLVNELDFVMTDWSNVSYPAFCFTGLESETDYWFVVTDMDTDASCEPLKIRTISDEFVTIGQSASEGAVIIKETFSELSHGGDPVNVAWGYSENAFIAPKDLVNWNTVDMTSMRLASWLERSEGHNYAGPGYIRVGDSSSQKDAIITPQLTSLAACATVEVSFKAAPYSSDYGIEGSSRLGECYAEVWVVNGDKQISAGVVELKDTPTEWTSCKVEAVNVLPGARIAIGGAYGEKTKTSGGKQYSRIYLDDVQVKLLRYEEVVAVVAPEVTVGKTFWSDSYISWTCGGEPKGYKVYVADEMVAELPADVTECHLTGLDAGMTYNVVVAALYNKSDEGVSRPAIVTTGSISQITKNLSPTSVSVAIENRAGDNTNNNNPCIYVEILDSADPETATKIYSTHVLDAQIQSPASPFMASLVVSNSKSRSPLNVAFGCLEPDKDYWFRVKSVKSYEFTTYQPSSQTTSNCSSTNGDSEFSKPIKVRTAALHTPVAGEILYLGFDELMIQADFVNCAVGSMPAFKSAGLKNSNMSLETIRTWNKDWSFYGLRTSFSGSQLAAHYAWATQQTKSDEVFTLSTENANGTIKGTAPGVGAKVYKFKDTCDGLSGWYSSNNTFASQGHIQLGAYYSSGDAKAQNLGMIATPALSSDLLGSESKACELSFKGLVLQGRSCSLGIWVYDSASKVWSNVENVNLHNSAGSTAAVESWSGLSDTHKWYEYKCTLQLKQGDMVAFATDTQGAAVVDDILLITK